MKKENRGTETGREERKEHPVHFEKRGPKRCSQRTAWHVEDAHFDFGDRIEGKQFRFRNESGK